MSETFNSAAEILYDDGHGGLLNSRGARIEGASVDYASGNIRIPKQPFAGSIQVAAYSEAALQNGAPPYTAVSGSLRTTGNVRVIAPQYAQASWVADPAARRLSETVAEGSQVFEVLADVPHPRAALPDSWRFEAGGEILIERGGVLYRNFNHLSGEAEAAGTFDLLSGQVRLDKTDPARPPEVRVLAGAYVAGEYQAKQFYGHTVAAPLKPRSLSVYAETGGQTLTGQSQADGRITGDLNGTVDYETGFFEITAAQPLPPESVRYNAVSQSHVPLDGAITGINAVRLPADGKVPVFRAGDTVVIGNRLKHPLGAAHTAGQTLQLPRQHNDRLCITDADGKHVAAEKYTADLDTGSLTWANPLDLSDYKMPLFAVCVWEEANRVVQTDISGSLKLQNPVSRPYPQQGTYVSGALLGGDLQTRATEPFSQAAWLKHWRDAPEGEPVLSRLNVKDYPIVLTADGAIDERWLILFKSGSQFALYGEQLGLLAEGDTLQDLAPVNPATGKPYFTLPHLAFGGGWEVGNCVRFNTFGTVLPVWLLRVVQPSPDKARGRDGLTVCLRGNTEVLES